MTHRCSVDDCENPALFGGVCKLHYSRMRKTGSYELKKPSNSWNSRYMHWRLLNKRYPEGTGWAGFADFDKDVGNRPAANFILTKIDENKLLGPENFQWVSRIGLYKRSEFDWNTPQGRSIAKKAYTKKTYDKRRLKKIRDAYGVPDEEYHEMHAEQNGRCAICGEPETLVKKGRVISLSVDHDHNSGKARGLLCNVCNRGLGLFRDNIDYLKNAIDYLRKHNGN